MGGNICMANIVQVDIFLIYSQLSLARYCRDRRVREVDFRGLYGRSGRSGLDSHRFGKNIELGSDRVRESSIYNQNYGRTRRDRIGEK